jgi:hypothetical protein
MACHLLRDFDSNLLMIAGINPLRSVWLRFAGEQYAMICMLMNVHDMMHVIC